MTAAVSASSTRAASSLTPGAMMGGPPSIAEAVVEFQREVSLIGVQGANGERVFYPLTENVHRSGILARSIAPYSHPLLQSRAETWLAAIMSRLDYRGVLTVEFFHTAAGLVANEMAPRVHNSGHWTIEGSETSQFENHLRAVLGWPLGSTAMRGHAAMLNLIGQLPPRETVLRTPGAHLHDYGKTRARRIHIVMDNVNTHCEKSMMRSYGRRVGRRIWRRVQLHPTPKHGSWLNQAEIEVGRVSRQVLGSGSRRICKRAVLRDEIRAFNSQANRERRVIHWKFTTRKARRTFGYKCKTARSEH